MVCEVAECHCGQITEVVWETHVSAGFVSVSFPLTEAVVTRVSHVGAGGETHRGLVAAGRERASRQGAAGGWLQSLASEPIADS